MDENDPGPNRGATDQASTGQASSATASSGTASSGTVALELDDGIAWVTMNRPEKRNAISPAMANEMLAVLDALESTSAARWWC